MKQRRFLGRGLWALGVFLLSAVVYSPSLRFDFVNLDDTRNLGRLNRSSISGPLLTEIWTEPFLGHYQPLIPMTWWTVMPLAHEEGHHPELFRSLSLDLHGLNPMIFHAVNIVIHSLNVVFVLLLLQGLGLNGWCSIIGALLFAFHPAQAESVGWISVLGGLLCSFFILLGSLTWLRYRKSQFESQSGSRRQAIGFYLLTLTSFLAAWLCKPLAVIFPFWIGILDWTIRDQRQKGRLTLKKRVLEMIPFFLVALPFLFQVRTAQPITTEMELWVKWIDRPWIALDSLRFALRRIVDLSLGAPDYGREPQAILTEPGIFTGLVIFAGVLLGAFLFLIRKRSTRILQCLGLFILPLVPVLGFVPFYNQMVSTVADRYLYLPLVGVSLALGSLIQKVPRRWSWAALCVIFLVVPNQNQLGIWQDSKSLFEANIKINPRSWLSMNNLGAYYEIVKQSELAIPLYLRSSEIHFRVEAVFRAAVMQLELGRIEEAKANYEIGLAAEPTNLIGQYDLAYCFFKMGQQEKARELLSQVLKIEPRIILSAWHFDRLALEKSEIQKQPQKKGTSQVWEIPSRYQQ